MDFPLSLLKPGVFWCSRQGGDGKLVKKRHPNAAGRCQRQKDVLRLSWCCEDGADFVPPACSRQRRARISSSASFPRFWLAAWHRATSPCVMPAGCTAAGWACSPGHPDRSRSPFPRLGCGTACFCLAVININTASAAPAPLQQQQQQLTSPSPSAPTHPCPARG